MIQLRIFVEVLTEEMKLLLYILKTTRIIYAVHICYNLFQLKCVEHGGQIDLSDLLLNLF